MIDECIFCRGTGYTQGSIFEVSKETCHKCKGSGEDQGIDFQGKRITNAEFVDLICVLGDNQRTCARKMTRIQVNYIRLLSGSDVLPEVLAKDLNVGIITIKNIWAGRSYNSW